MPRSFRMSASLGLAVLLLSGCATLPDTSNYTAATIDLKQAMVSAGGAVESEIVAASQVASNQAAKRDIAAGAVQFRTAWDRNVAALQASVEYAQSIEAIVGAGNEGGASARKVADSASAFVTALGIAAGPAGPLAGALTSTGAFAYQELAKIRAAKSLKAAIAASGPLIVALQAKVREQLPESQLAFTVALDAQARALRDEDAYGLYLSRSRELEDVRRAQLDLLAQSASSPRSFPAEQVQAAKAKLKSLEELGASFAPKVAEANLKLAELDRRRKAGLALFAATDAALAEWGVAHGRIVEAIQNHRSVTVSSLSAAVTDLRGLLKEWKSL